MCVYNFEMVTIYLTNLIITDPLRKETNAQVRGELKENTKEHIAI